MKLTAVTITVILFFQVSIICCQNIQKELSGLYLGWKPHGKVLEIFAPEIMNAEQGYHSTVIFSTNLDEAFRRTMDNKNGGFLYSKIENRAWTKPQNSNFGIEITDPAFSPDDKKLCKPEEGEYRMYQMNVTIIQELKQLN